MGVVDDNDGELVFPDEAKQARPHQKWVSPRLQAVHQLRERVDAMRPGHVRQLAQQSPGKVHLILVGTAPKNSGRTALSNKMSDQGGLAYAGDAFDRHDLR